MPVFELNTELIFPHPSLAEANGLLAYGGDLSVDRLLLAYSNGIFPWFSPGEPIMWWALDPRMVLFPDNLKVSKSLKQAIHSKGFNITFDRNFETVIRNCANAYRPDQGETWITSEMQQAYMGLHSEGFAHSVEVWLQDEIVGGLYGVSLGKVFFGESMFFLHRDASKVALFYLVEKLKKWNFDLIDAQQDTAHMRSMGAELISFEDFLGILKKSLKHPTIQGKWS